MVGTPFVELKFPAFVITIRLSAQDQSAMSSDCSPPFLEKLIKKITSDDFDKINFDRFYTEIPKKCKDEPCVLGVDEAGRGPVLGPMVYAVCYCPLKEIEIIKGIGCTDSKTLTEKKREEIFELINNKKNEIGWAADVISPNYISNKMQKRIKYSLNEIAQNSTIKLIENILQSGVDLREIYVDTIGPPDKYQEKLSKLFPKCKIVVEKKADLIYPVVGAASICAKVIRDTVIQNWRFPELIDITDNDFGTGYPGDPKSKQFLTENKDEIFGYPHLVRFSWSTAGKMLEGIVPVEWEDEEEAQNSENQNISAYFKPINSSESTKHKSKFHFFKERSLSSLESF